MPSEKRTRPARTFHELASRIQHAADLEDAWVQWSRTTEAVAIKDVDAQTMWLLQVAFEAGYEARR